MMSQSAHQRLLSATLWMVLIFIVGYLLVIAQTLIIPLVLAIFIWYVINMLVTLSGKIRLGGRVPPRPLRFLISGLLLFLAGYLVVYIITSNINDVVEAAPLYQANLQRVFDDASARLDFIDIPPLSRMLGDLEFGRLLGNLATGFGTLIGNVGLIGIYLIFLFLEQRFFPSKLAAVVHSQASQERVRGLLHQIEKDVRTYVAIKTMVSLITAVASWVVMTLVGLDFAGFWALLIFVLNFIPNVGSLVATVLPSLLALMQFDGLTPFLIIALGVGGIQLLVGNLLEPNLMGKSLNVSPLVIMLSLVFWGFIWGVPGMFLCVPLTVVAMIVLYNFDNTRWLAQLMSQDGQIKPK